MRRWLALLTFAVASCAAAQHGDVQTSPSSGVVTGMDVLDQGWSDADRRIFSTTPQGSYVMPYAWFGALRRANGAEAFAGDQLRRFGYMPTAASSGAATPLPLGFVRDGTAADPQLGMTCAACHTGQINYKGKSWRIDGGRTNADFQSFLIDLGASVRATVAEPDRFNAFAAAVLGPGATSPQTAQLRSELVTWNDSYTRFMKASLPDLPWGPGRLDAFGMIFNRVAGLDLKYPANIHKADAPVRYPFIWDAPRQDRIQWTGAAPNGTYLRGMARNTGEAFGVFARLDPAPLAFSKVIYHNSVDHAGLQTLEEKVVKLRPPHWPTEIFGLDNARAKRGETIFKTECASCHGLTPSHVVSNAWNTPVMDVGTDRRTFDNSKVSGSPRVLTGSQEPPIVGDRLTDPSPTVMILANSVVGSLLQAALAGDEGIKRAIQQDFAENRLPLAGAAPPSAPAMAVMNATKNLYKAADNQPGAAYEARVLTGIWAVGPYLHNGSVPNLWELLKPAAQRVKRFGVGNREFDPVHVGFDTDPVPGGAVFVANPANGNGNGGHEYGVTLSDADRWALIEYLKTL